MTNDEMPMNGNGHVAEAQAPEDFRHARGNGGALRVGDPRSADRQPPHSVEAEQGVLGCILLSPMECLAECERQRVEPEWFYDLRHRGIYQAIRNMRGEWIAGTRPLTPGLGAHRPALGGHRPPLQASEGQRESSGGIDVVTVRQRLRDHGHLRECGGVVYLASLPDTAPSAANLRYYLDILRQKWVLRQIVGECAAVVGEAYEFSGEVGTLVERWRGRIDGFAQGMVNPAETSSLLRPVSDFAEALFNRWFQKGLAGAEPGWKLPPDGFGEFPFKIRTKEQSLVLGEKGKGKTTMLSYIALHLMGQGAHVVIASMEMAPVETLDTLARQLLGTAPNPYEHKLALSDDKTGHDSFKEAVKWLRARCEILDFRGVVQYRMLLDEFKRARDRGFNVFVVDNIMKLGLLEDDMAGHGMAANEFSAFAVGADAHVFIVNHLNKSEGNSRQRSRGSARWPDASHNVFTIDRNEKKWEKLSEFKRRLEEGILTKAEYDEETAVLRLDWDGKLILHNQRLQGSVQNASRAMWFVFAGSQYVRVDGNVKSVPLLYEKLAATKWLEKWRGRMTNDE